MPASVTHMGSGAIGYNAKLKVITFLSTTPPQATGDVSPIINDDGLTKIVVPASAVDTYKAVSWLSDKANIIVAPGEEPTAITEFTSGNFLYKILDNNCVGVSGFAEGITMSEIIIPATVTNANVSYTVTAVQPSAFSGASLTSVTLPQGLKTIGMGAFEKCSSLTSITIPETVDSIGNAAFQLSGLTSVILPEATTKLGNSIFYKCAQLASVTLNGQPVLPILMFESCKKLTSIDLTGVKTIGDYCFRSCTTLAEVNLPDVESVGNQAFNSLLKCVKVTFPDNPDAVYGNNAFSSMSILPEVTLPPVENIGDNMFGNCYELAKVTIPASIQTLPATFDRCFGLKEITCLGTVPPTCNNTTFGSLTRSNILLHVPAGSTAAYMAADYWKDFNFSTATSIEIESSDPVDNGSTDCYDLTGRRVSNPGHGFFIKKSGTKTSKILM